MNAKKIIPYVLIVIVLFVAAGIYVSRHLKQSDAPFISGTQSGSSGEKVEMGDYGAAPDFAGVTHWLNSDPLTIASLKGKVVLVDFWTYTCINCIRTLPYVTKWYDTYKDQGLVVVGVHTPEFSFEKDTNNVADAIKRFNIHYPVAQDNVYGTWNAYSNHYWPAEYLIDKNGEIVYTHFGEGEYDHTENAIRHLLGLDESAPPQPGENLDGVGSPEMYFGTERLENLTGDQKPSAVPQKYVLPGKLDLNKFALQGSWQFTPQGASLVSGKGVIQLRFHSAKLHMVASSGKPAVLTILVDGKAQPSVTVKDSELYTLFDSDDYSDHVIEINITQAGFQAFTFTFG